MSNYSRYYCDKGLMETCKLIIYLYIEIFVTRNISSSYYFVRINPAFSLEACECPLAGRC